MTKDLSLTPSAEMETWVELMPTPQYLAPLYTEALGIDFGTTFSAVALSQNPDHTELLGPLIPSVLRYQIDNRGMGSFADDGPFSIHSVKRWLTPECAFEPKWHGITPFQAAVELFIRIARQAQKVLGRAIWPAVVTVPAYFDEARRALIKRAGECAGFEVLRLLSEPTAAALCYRLADEEGIYGVYDLGGGTFDFSLISLKQGLFRVLASGGHSDLGGDDFDQILANHWGWDQAQARAHKEQGFMIPAEVEKAWQKLIDQTAEICLNTLADGQITLGEVKDFLLVGGSSKIKGLKERLSLCFKRQPLLALDPDTSVARGASLQAYNLTHDQAFLLLDVSPLSLGIETYGGLVERILPRNTPLPAEKEMMFTTGEDGQTRISVHVIQGEQETVGGCRSLGKFSLPVEAAPRGYARIKITFSLDADGLLTVTALDARTGKAQSLDVNTSYGMTPDMIAREWKREGEDLFERLWIEKHTHARQALKEVYRWLTSNLAKSIGQTIDLEEVKKACTALEMACGDKDLERLVQEWEIFLQVATPFIEKAMTERLKETFA